MLKRRVFIKGLISTGVVLGSTPLDPFLKTLNSQTTRAEKRGGLVVPKIRIVGLGGSGGKIIDYMIRSGLNGVDFILADRDIRALNYAPSQQFIRLETDLSRIEGGAEESFPATYKKDKRKILQALEGSDLVFIITGRGGGTGTFWGPVIAEICSQLGIFSLAVTTWPLVNGPSQPRRWAEKGMEKLSSFADTVIEFYLADFDSTLFPENNLGEVYNLAQQKMLEAIKGITGLMLSPGLISLDLNNLKLLCNKKGLGAFQVGIAKGPGRVRKAVEMAISELSYRGNRLAYFQQVLLGLIAGPKLDFEEVIEASDLIRKEIDDQATIIWGSKSDETIGEEFRVMIFASGRKYKKPQWAETIFSQVENKNLNIELEKLAKERNWTLREGEPLTPDIIATPYFISIVDRSLIGEECWNMFLEFCRESGDDTPLIIVDNLRHLKLPDHQNITFVDLNNPQAFDEIKTVIRKIGV